MHLYFIKIWLLFSMIFDSILHWLDSRANTNMPFIVYTHHQDAVDVRCLNTSSASFGIIIRSGTIPTVRGSVWISSKRMAFMVNVRTAKLWTNNHSTNWKFCKYNGGKRSNAVRIQRILAHEWSRYGLQLCLASAKKQTRASKCSWFNILLNFHRFS